MTAPCSRDGLARRNEIHAGLPEEMKCRRVVADASDVIAVGYNRGTTLRRSPHLRKVVYVFFLHAPFRMSRIINLIIFPSSYCNYYNFSSFPAGSLILPGEETFQGSLEYRYAGWLPSCAYILKYKNY